MITVRHRAAVAGRLTDAESGKPLAGARVEITAAPPELAARLIVQAEQFGARWAAMEERPDRARTAADGHFHFLDLPAGDYTLTASLPRAGSRYGTESVAVAVTSGSLAAADMALPPTTVKGRLTGPGPDNEPVALALVRVRGSGERTYSDAAGDYRLSALEKGERTVVVTARGFAAPPPQTVVLADAGAVATLDLTLQTE